MAGDIKKLEQAAKNLEQAAKNLENKSKASDNTKKLEQAIDSSFKKYLPKFSQEKSKKDTGDNSDNSSIADNFSEDRKVQFGWMSKNLLTKSTGTVNDLIDFFRAGALKDGARDEKLFELLERKDESGKPDKVVAEDGLLTKLLGGFVLAIPAFSLGVMAGLAAKILSWVSSLTKPLRDLAKYFTSNLNRIFKNTFGKGSKFFKFFSRIGKLIKTIAKPVLKFIDVLLDIGKTLGRFAKITSQLKGVQKAGSVVGQFISHLTNLFKSKIFSTFGGLIKAFKTASGLAKTLSPITKFFFGFGKWFGKFFAWPLTLLIVGFDVVKEALAGFKKDGIIGGIKGAISGLINGLIGSMVTGIAAAAGWIASALGFDKLGAKLTNFSQTFDLGKIIISGIETAGEKISSLGEYISEKFMAAANFISDGLSGIGDSISGAFDTLGNLLGGVGDSISETLGPIKESISQFFGGIGDKIGSAISSGIDAIKEFFVTLSDGSLKKKILSKLKTVGDTLLSNIVGPIETAFSFVKDAFGGFVSGIRDTLHGLAKDLFESIPTLTGTFADTDTGKAILESIKPTSEEDVEVELPAVATGGIFKGTQSGIIAQIGEQNVTEVVSPLSEFPKLLKSILPEPTPLGEIMENMPSVITLNSAPISNRDISSQEKSRMPVVMDKTLTQINALDRVETIAPEPKEALLSGDNVENLLSGIIMAINTKDLSPVVVPVGGGDTTNIVDNSGRGGDNLPMAAQHASSMSRRNK